MKALGDFYRFAEKQNITVDFFPLQSREALSLMDEQGRCFVAIDREKLRGEADERAKLAHELGHCATGAFYNRYSPWDCRRRHENKADKWAVIQLVEEDALDEAIADGCCTLWELAEHFGVPETVMKKAVCWYTYGNVADELYF
jgi:Zn-dependent peptidase ImmA (M78 family)